MDPTSLQNLLQANSSPRPNIQSTPEQPVSRPLHHIAPKLPVKPPEKSGSGNSSSPIWSPTFQCFTTLAFYANLLIELQNVASHVDRCRETAREAVWHQLFSLLGVNYKSINVFGPILTMWLNSPTVNLLAIELLYVSFALTLLQHAELFELSAEPSAESSNEIRRRTAGAAVTADPAGLLSNLTAASNFAANAGPAMKPAPPVPGTTNPVLPAAVRGSQPLRPSAPTDETSLHATKYRLLLLQMWAPALDNLPSKARSQIWNAPRLAAYKSFENGTFQAVLQVWASNAAAYCEAIDCLFAAIQQLADQGQIPRDLLQVGVLVANPTQSAAGSKKKPAATNTNFAALLPSVPLAAGQLGRNTIGTTTAYHSLKPTAAVWSNSAQPPVPSPSANRQRTLSEGATTSEQITAPIPVTGPFSFPQPSTTLSDSRQPSPDRKRSKMDVSSLVS